MLITFDLAMKILYRNKIERHKKWSTIW